ncbi:hypothetical protein RJI07_08765 [Mycoplasmatota bacterium WC30]
MLNKKLLDDLTKEVKEKGRLIDFYLLENLFECRQLQLMEELQKYQNVDGGFGHALEPDVRLPDSSVVATDMAINILNEIDDEPLKAETISKMISYYESVYIDSKNGWELVPPAVNNYPRAVWWNYDGVENFTYGNPNPEIVGFLYKYKQYLKKLDIAIQVNKVTEYIKNTFQAEASMHSLLSCLKFYTYMPEEIKSEIHDTLQLVVDKELANDNWEEYSLEPYKILLIAPIFLKKHELILERNLEYCKDKLNKGIIIPNWSWYQYDDVFEETKHEWAGFITYEILKSLLK